MALSDPFGTTFEGAKQGLGSFGQAFQQIAQQLSENEAQKRAFQQKAGLAEVEAKAKQLYPDPMTLMYMKMLGIPTPGQGETNKPTTTMQIPATSRAEAEQRLKAEGKNPLDFNIKEQITSGPKGLKTSSFVPEPIPLNPLNAEQEKTLNSSISAMNNLRELKRLRKEANIQTGPLTTHDPMNPLGMFVIRRSGNQPDIDFEQNLRSLQSNWITAQTGAQRGFQEMRWLLPALPGGELKPENFDKAVNSAIDALERNTFTALGHAKNARHDIAGYNEVLKQLEPKYAPVAGEFKTEDEAFKSGLPKGSIIKVGGRKARL